MRGDVVGGEGRCGGGAHVRVVVGVCVPLSNCALCSYLGCTNVSQSSLRRARLGGRGEDRPSRTLKRCFQSGGGGRCVCSVTTAPHVQRDYCTACAA